MATEAERLVVTLEANIKSYLASIKKLEDGNKKMFRELKTLIDRSSRQNESAMAQMGARMGTAFHRGFRRIMLAAGAAGIARMIGGAIKQIADLGDAAIDLGIKAQHLQVWNRMAIAAGQSSETMARALAEVAEQAEDAGSGLSKLFAVQGKKPTGDVEQDMLTLMRILTKAKSAGEQLAALKLVFGGRLGRRLAESLRGGPEAFFQEYARMQKAGELLTDKQIAQARELEEAYNRIVNIFSTTFAQAILDVFGDMGTFEEDLKTGLTALMQIFRALLQIFKDTVGEINKIKEGIQQWNNLPIPDWLKIDLSKLNLGNLNLGGTGGKPSGAAGTASQQSVLRRAAQMLGTSPENLATVISYETGGTFSPAKRGGKGGKHLGLIQFGPAEQAQFGAHAGQSFEEQMVSVVGYLKARGFKPGMSILDLYSTINAGQPGRYNASDRPGMTVATHTAAMMGAHRRRALGFLGDSSDVTPTHVSGEGGILPPSEEQLAAERKAYEDTNDIIETLMKQREQQLESYAAKFEEMNDLMAGAVSGFADDLMNGVDAGEAFHNMLKKLASQLVDMAIQNLFSLGGAPGGLFGNLFGGAMPKAPGFQHGGRFKVGGSGGTDSSLVAFRATPGEMVTVSPRSLRGSHGGASVSTGGTVIHINGHADERTVALMDRRIQENNYRQRRELQREWGGMSVKYNQLRSP